MKLQVIQNKAFDRNIANVYQTAELLADLTVRAGITTSQDVQDRLEAATHAAQEIAATVDLGAIEAGLNEAGRPASAQEIKRQLQVLIGSFPNSGRNDLAIFGVALLDDRQPGVAESLERIRTRFGQVRPRSSSQRRADRECRLSKSRSGRKPEEARSLLLRDFWRHRRPDAPAGDSLAL